MCERDEDGVMAFNQMLNSFRIGKSSCFSSHILPDDALKSVKTTTRQRHSIDDKRERKKDNRKTHRKSHSIETDLQCAVFLIFILFLQNRTSDLSLVFTAQLC